MASIGAERRRARAGRDGSSGPPRPAAVRDFTGGAHTYQVEFELRTAYDFLISASIGDGAECDLLPDEREWLDRARADLGSDLRDALDACFGPGEPSVFHGLASLIATRGDILDAAALMTALDEAGPAGIARVVIADIVPLGTSIELIDRAIAGDSAAFAELEPLLGEWSRDAVRTFLSTIEASVATMRRALAAWLERFVEIEPRVRRFAEADLATRAAERRTLATDALIERVTGGLRFLPEAHVRRVILAPSYFGRPFNHVYQGGDWRLFCYPIADSVLESADATTPPASMVRLHRALGDSTRMRVLRLLADREWYLTELATQLDLSKPTMKHHLAILRAAGLVTMTEEGSLTFYSLRRERIEEAGAELRRFIR